MKKLLPLLLLALLAPPPVTASPKLRGRFEPVVAETDSSLWAVRVFPGGRIRICGADGTFVTTEDGGETWRERQIEEGVSLRTMEWIDDRRGVVAGVKGDENVIRLTTDGGETFREGTLSVPRPIRAMAFLDRARGWLVAGSEKGGEGAWRRTENGGDAWKERDSVAFRHPARALFGVAAAGGKFLWAVGGHVEVALVGDAARSLLYRKKDGAVLHSDDGGTSWFVQSAGNPQDVRLRGVDFVDPEIGWVVGDKGFAARTTDGGTTWEVLDTGVTVRLNAVDALSAKTAFAVGADGVAVATGDGGESFAKLPTGTESILRDVSFLDASTGWAVGRAGTVLRFVRGW